MTRTLTRIAPGVILVVLVLLAAGTAFMQPRVERVDAKATASVGIGPVFLRWAASLSLLTPSPSEPWAALRTLAARDKEEEKKQDRVLRGPYDAWETWSENPVKPVCTSKEDCEPDRTGRETYCKKVRGASEKDRGYCRPRWLTRKQQATQRRNLQRIVEHVCTPPSWWTPEVKCWKFPGRTAKVCNAKKWCNPDKLTKFFSIPALRESTWDHQTDHHLDRDRVANQRSYRRMYKRGVYKDNPYFNEGQTLGRTGKPLFRERDLRVHCDRDSELDRDCNGVPDMWEVGYGWYGLNAAIYTWRFDPNAPSTVLAKRVPSTIALLRNLRSAWRKLDGGVDCRDAEGRLYSPELMRSSEQERDYTRDTWPEKTWWTLHRAVFGGDICPLKLEGHKHYRRSFVKRAQSKRVGLDPDEKVTMQMLGTPVPFEDQWRVVAEIEATFEPVWEREPEPEPEKDSVKVSAVGSSSGVEVTVAAAQ